MAMANPKYSHIARPYAVAAFEYARDNSQLPAWKIFLTSATDMVRQPAVATLLAKPEILTTQLFEFFISVLTSLLNAEQKNFLHLLAQNKRLMLLPEIMELFNTYYTAFEKITIVHMVTAIAIPEGLRNKFTQALTKRVQSKVILQCTVDPAILAGAIIHVGDNKVIDGSVRGKLTRLLEFSLR